MFRNFIEYEQEHIPNCKRYYNYKKLPNKSHIVVNPKCNI